MIDFKNGSVLKLKKVSDVAFNDEIKPLLVEGETVVGCYQDLRDHVVFTNKRIISVYSIETAGTFDLDSELDLYYSGVGLVKFEFKGASDIVEIGRMISQYALR